MARQALSLVDVPESTRDLTDFSSTEPTDGQVPVWDSGEGKYVPGANGGGAQQVHFIVPPANWFLSTPPSHAAGKTCVIGGSPTGAWAGKSPGTVATSDGTTWSYYDPATASYPAIVTCGAATFDAATAGVITLRADLGVGWRVSGPCLVRSFVSGSPLSSAFVGLPYFIDNSSPFDAWNGKGYHVAIGLVGSPSVAGDWLFLPVDFGSMLISSQAGQAKILYDTNSVLNV